MNYVSFELIKRKIYVRLRSVYSLKSVSNHYVILGSMSFQSLVPSNLCPLMSHPEQCPFKNISISSDLCPLTAYSDTQKFFNGPLTVCDMHSMVHSFIFIRANIKHIHLSKKHHKSITLNKINRFKNSA